MAWEGYAAWDNLNSNPPLLRSYYYYEKTFRLESGQFLRDRKQSLPRNTKAKLALLLHATHRQWEMPPKDPKVWLTVKLGLQDRILQEQYLGTCVQAPGQKEA